MVIKIVRFILLIFVISTGIFVFINMALRPRPMVSPKATTNSLSGAVNNALDNTQGTYAIVIKNLKNGQTYYSNEHKVFDSGSLYKLWIMATVYKQIQADLLTEGQVLSEDVATLNQVFNIDSDLAELTDGTITLTVSDALHQMITISHNYAALLLTEKIKLSSVATYLEENGFNESAIGTDTELPTSTASDIALFLEKLYMDKLGDPQYKEKMLNLLKAQQLNDGLPKYLGDIVVAHKTGDIDWLKHDAGIVFAEKGDYIIVIMSESKAPAAAQERIALVSKAVYDYFELTAK